MRPQRARRPDGAVARADSRDAERAEGSHRGDEIDGRHRNLSDLARRRHRRAASRTTRRRCPKAWSCSTPSIRFRPSQANDLAVRWNCKAGKCGSCSAEVNGHPRLMCMTRLNELDLDEPVTVEPMRSFPADQGSGHRRLVELSRKDERSSRSSRGRPTRRTERGAWSQADVERVQEFRKCIECFLCQDVCHVLRDHQHVRRVRRPAVSRLRRGARDASARHATIARRS